ncbi:hypothetical protein [Carboxylicivirga caseinilyticus]|uniref:hypothetical protein n=1 Tax=Carboxylicivirga caseinilyticus TaxID=3417572 RepID=UPI003D33692A|nr:hypothetical protein [Marinilabiliaceae bacterium A049]
MKTIFVKYSESVILIIVALAIYFVSRNPEIYGVENTNLIKGRLSDNPAKGVHDEDYKYIGLWIAGYDDLFEFSGCSYNSRIAKEVLKLQKGDEVVLHTQFKSSSITIPWKGKKYRTYKICDAYCSKSGTIITFDQFNECNNRLVNKLIPGLCLGLLLIGLYKIIRKVKDDQNTKELIVSNYASTKPESEDVIKLKPDRLSFLIRKSYYSIVFIGFGIYKLYPINSQDLDVLGIAAFTLGILLIPAFLILHQGIFYIVDPNGVYIKEKSIFFQNESEFTSYTAIKEVSCRQNLFEYAKNIGSVYIDTGETDENYNTIYYKLIGIKNHRDIAKIILKRANLSGAN